MSSRDPSREKKRPAKPETPEAVSLWLAALFEAQASRPVVLMKEKTRADGTPALPSSARGRWGGGGRAHFEVAGERVGGLHALIDDAFPTPPACCVEDFNPGHSYPERVKEAYGKKTLCVNMLPTFHGKAVESDLKRILTGKPPSRKRQRIDPCATELYNFFKARRWDVFMIQWPVYSAALRVATASDFIAYDRNTGEIVLIELKVTTGIGDVRYKNHSQEIAIFPDGSVEYLAGASRPAGALCIPNSQYCRDTMQLLTTAWIFGDSYGARPHRKCLVRVHLAEIKVYDADPGLEAHFDFVLKAMQRRRLEDEAASADRVGGKRRGAPRDDPGPDRDATRRRA